MRHKYHSDTRKKQRQGRWRRSEDHCLNNSAEKRGGVINLWRRSVFNLACECNVFSRAAKLKLYCSFVIAFEGLQNYQFLDKCANMKYMYINVMSYFAIVSCHVNSM